VMVMMRLLMSTRTSAFHGSADSPLWGGWRPVRLQTLDGALGITGLVRPDGSK